MEKAFIMASIDYHQINIKKYTIIVRAILSVVNMVKN